MREPVVAQVLTPVAQVVRLQGNVVVETLLKAAADMVAIDRKHGLDVDFARCPYDNGALAARWFRLNFVFVLAHCVLFVPSRTQRLFGDHVSMQADAAGCIRLAIDALDLHLESWEGVEARLEYLQ